MAMHTVESALAAVLRECRPFPIRGTHSAAAIGDTLARSVLADLDMPPFDKSLVDGYAVKAADLAGIGPRSLRVVDEIDAGRVPRRAIGAGEASLIMTGAPLPDGADAVVMLEEVEREADGLVRVIGPVRPGQNRLRRGQEYRAGEVLLRAGSVLNAPRVGLLASSGHATITVVDRPRIGVVATGDELVSIRETPGPGQIRNSNGTMLSAWMRDLGYMTWDFGDLPDRAEALCETFGQILAGRFVVDEDPADVLLVSGGVSAGRRDLVPAALEAAGVRPVFHKVKVKPGKPLWFGVGPEREGRPPVLVFGLPGNPVSGIVSVLLFVVPALAVMSGRPARPAAVERVRLTEPFRHRGPRATYHPARRLEDDPGAVAPLAWAGSADLRTVALADGFAVFPEGDADYPAGSVIDFLPIPSTPPGSAS